MNHSSSELHVETFGDRGPKDPVILLHSSGLSGRQWKRLVSALVDRGHRVVVPDLSGHGSSPAWPEPKPFSYRTDVAHVAAMIRAEPRAHVIGHSYGGLVALHAALEVEEHMRSLALFDPVAFGVLDGTKDEALLAGVRAVDVAWGPTAQDRERWLKTFVEYWGGEGAWSALREEMRAEFQRAAWVVREGVRSLIADGTRKEAYAALRIPTTLFTGSLTPPAEHAVLENLRDAIPGARVVVVENAGHLAPLAQANKVNPLFIESLERA